MRDQLLSFDSIPGESFCGDWNGYVASFDVIDGKMIPTVGKDFFAITYENNAEAGSNRPVVDNTEKPIEKSTTVTVTSNADQATKQSNNNNHSKSPIQNSLSTQAKSAATKGNFSEKMLSQFSGWYTDKLVQLTEDEFAHCLSILRILRASHYFTLANIMRM